MSKNTEGDAISTVYTRLNLEKSKFKWVKNASARFDPNPLPPNSSVLNFTEIKSTICEPVKIYYDKELGETYELRLGPSCQTVSSQGWKHPENDLEYLFPFKCYEAQEDLDRFIMHPWITDAMVQTQAYILAYLRRTEMKTKLFVPVLFDKFVWWGHSKPSGFVYVKVSNGDNEAHMYDDTGRLMASLIGLEIVETSLQSIMGLIDSHRSLYPMMAECIWNENMGPEEKRISDFERGTISLHGIVETLEVCSKFTGEEESFYTSLQQLTGLYMLKAVTELGINEEPSFSWPNITAKLKVPTRLSKFFRYILLEMANDGYFELQVGQQLDNEVIHFVRSQSPQTSDVGQICAKISKTEDMVFAAHPELVNNDITNAKKAWSNLVKILTGQTSPIYLEERLRKMMEKLLATPTLCFLRNDGPWAH